MIKKKTLHNIAFVLATLCLWVTGFAQQINGQVVDAATNDPMPGVAILYNTSRNLGVVTDRFGRFEIPNRADIVQVEFSFIGYSKLVVPKADVPRNGAWTVTLQPETEQLEEVEVLAGENPALRIVRNAIDHRNANNPRKYSSYSYVSYNKDVITYTLKKPDTIFSKELEQAYVKDSIKSNSRHMFVLESVTRKWHKAPNRDKEVVVGTKISGFKNPSVGAVPDGIQNFGFHENVFPMLNKKFLNPIADGADKKYVYILQDTLYDGSDTVFTMDYFPEKGANFDGLKGRMSIHTHNWALVRVTAFPFDEGKVNILLEQDYQLVNGEFWFPRHMNFALDLEQLPLRKTGAVMIGKTTLDSVQINTPIDDERFNHIEVELDEKAGFVDDLFWDKYRTEELSQKELQTYREMDSIGNRYKWDAVLEGTRKIYEGFIVMGKFDVEYSKLLAYNQYEGLRLGLGLYTNEKISKKFRVGGYFGHGAADKAWKYGGTAYWYFDKPNDFYIKAWYLNDVRNPGGVRIMYREWKTFAQQFFYRLMDQVEEGGASLTYRAGRYSRFTVGLRKFKLRTTYNYTFKAAPQTDGGRQEYNFTELQLKYRWQFKEKYSTNLGQRISKGSKYPVVSVIYSRGLNDVLNSQFEYNKIEVGIFLQRYTKNLGKTRVALELGLVDRPVPWSMNFSGRPSYNPSFSVVVKESFQTMRFNEFASSQYVALFFSHDFGPLLLRNKWLKPEFRVFQGITYGTLRNPELHEGIPFKTLDEGYYETGLVLDNIIRLNMFNTGYIGFGGGVFYRYGANHFPNELDNYTFKFSIMYSVN